MQSERMRSPQVHKSFPNGLMGNAVFSCSILSNYIDDKINTSFYSGQQLQATFLLLYPWFIMSESISNQTAAPGISSSRCVIVPFAAAVSPHISPCEVMFLSL